MLKKIEKMLEEIKSETEELHPILVNLLPKISNVTDFEYTHGQSEMGADFVLQVPHSVFGNNEYVGIIAKRGQVKQDFTDIERQIDECFSIKRYFFNGKDLVNISEVWVVATSTITENAKVKINEKYKGRKIEFIDGDRLASLIKKHLPNFGTDIPLEIGEYLNRLRQHNDDCDRNLSLLHLDGEPFYIEQDIREVEEFEYTQKKKVKSGRKSINIVNEIEKNDVLLIEGAMGAGKSKLIRNLVESYTDKENYLKKKVVPIVCSYKELVDDCSGDINEMVMRKLGAKVVAELVDDNDVLLLIDSIDEKNVPVDEQAETVRKLSKQVKERKHTRALITSRYLRGIEKAEGINHNIKRYEIAPMSFGKVIEFITKICSRLNISSRIIEDLKKSPLFKDLPSSPIAAILLAKLLKENPQDIPSHLTELYSKYTELMLGRWDVDKGLQSEKEYEALVQIMMDLSKYVLENELSSISIGEVKQRFNDYLAQRNLRINSESLFQKMASRCEMISVNETENTFCFKHRTFAEFLYAKKLASGAGLKVDHRAFHPYWMHSFFFYAGILKDCPQFLEELVKLETESEVEKWLKIINIPNLFMAGYASPYENVQKGISRILSETAKFYLSIVNGEIESKLAVFPRMQVLCLLQYLIRTNYAFEYFEKALEGAALEIEYGDMTNEQKSYALFFLAVIGIDLGSYDSFEAIIENKLETLPLDVKFAIHHELENKEKSKILRKMERRIKRSVVDNPKLKNYITEMYEKPIRRIALHSKKVNKPWSA